MSYIESSYDSQNNGYFHPNTFDSSSTMFVDEQFVNRNYQFPDSPIQRKISKQKFVPGRIFFLSSNYLSE